MDTDLHWGAAHMTQPTAYQYVKLGSNLEYLRGLCTTSLMQTTSLVAFPALMDNLSAKRYAAEREVAVVKSLLVQLRELGLDESLRVAEPLQPMLKEVEDYLQLADKPELAYLNDQFAHRLIGISNQVAMAVRSELSARSGFQPDALP